MNRKKVPKSLFDGYKDRFNINLREEKKPAQQRLKAAAEKWVYNGIAKQPDKNKYSFMDTMPLPTRLYGSGVPIFIKNDAGNSASVKAEISIEFATEYVPTRDLSIGFGDVIKTQRYTNAHINISIPIDFDAYKKFNAGKQEVEDIYKMMSIGPVSIDFMLNGKIHTVESCQMTSFSENVNSMPDTIRADFSLVSTIYQKY